MSTPRALALLAGLATATLATAARADIPPDPDSADAHCTPAEQCPSGTYCDYAFRPGGKESDWKTVGADCRTDAESRGLERRCRNGGNYGGQHLYCPKGETGSWSPGQKTSPPPPPIPPPTPPAPATDPTPAPATNPAPAPAPASNPPPAKAGMCSLAPDATPPLALLLLLGLTRRRR